MNELRINKSSDRSKSKRSKNSKITQSPQKSIISSQNSQLKISSFSINKLTHSKSTKSQKITQASQKQNISFIQKQYTKQTFRRSQQKLDIGIKIQQIIEQIKSKQKKLQNFFQIYRILQSQTGQQRCLQHNNDFSLYCLTENKVICVHCMYGNSKHKTHKVLPLKDCGKDIQKDNLALKQSIQTNLQDIKYKIKIISSNEHLIQNLFRTELKQMQRSYGQKLLSLQKQFLDKKKYLNQYFQNIILKNTQLKNSVKMFQNDLCLKMSTIKQNLSEIKFFGDLKAISIQTILSKINQISNINHLVIDTISSKDLGQNCLRNRLKSAVK